MKTDFLRGFVIGLVLSCVLAIGLYLVFGPEVPVPMDPMDVDLVEVDRVETIHADGISQEVVLNTSLPIFDCPVHGMVGSCSLVRRLGVGVVIIYTGPRVFCSRCVANEVIRVLRERGLNELELAE